MGITLALMSKEKEHFFIVDDDFESMEEHILRRFTILKHEGFMFKKNGRHQKYVEG